MRKLQILFLVMIAVTVIASLSHRYFGKRTPLQRGARPVPGVKRQEGDLVFQTSTSAQSKAIQLATHSPYSHCGIVLKRQGEWMVLEAVQPVKYTPLKRWIARGKNGEVVVKRLRPDLQPKLTAALPAMKAAGNAMLSKDYDLGFGWSDDKIYCSELIWKVYQRSTGLALGSLQRLGDFDLRHPAVRKKMQERYGRHLPLEEPVISPAAVFESELLVEIREKDMELY